MSCAIVESVNSPKTFVFRLFPRSSVWQVIGGLLEAKAATILFRLCWPWVWNSHSVWNALLPVSIVSQTRMAQKTFENLASRYVFHFVGDSTTRRLAESFISISTGIHSDHETYHANRNVTIGGLQVRTAHCQCVSQVSRCCVWLEGQLMPISKSMD